MKIEFRNATRMKEEATARETGDKFVFHRKMTGADSRLSSVPLVGEGPLLLHAFNFFHNFFLPLLTFTKQAGERKVLQEYIFKPYGYGARECMGIVQNVTFEPMMDGWPESDV